MIGFIIILIGIACLIRLNIDKLNKPSLNGEYARAHIDLDRTRDDLKQILSLLIDKHDHGIDNITTLKQAIALEEQEIDNINKNKKQLYKDYKSSAFKAFANDYPKTMHLLRNIKYVVCSIPLLILLKYVDVHIIGNTDGIVVKFALLIMSTSLLFSPLVLGACVLDEKNEIKKRPKNQKEFVAIECNKHSLYMKKLRQQIYFETESIIDLNEKIKLIEDELARRDAKVNTAISQVNHTKSTSITREENKKKLELAILDTDWITGKLKRARSTQSILKLTDAARERIAKNAIILKASQAKMQKVELVTANDQLKELLASIESRLIEQMKQDE